MRIRQHGTEGQKGFTIVELIVVIAVIGILATISILGYGGWRSTTISNQVKSDLNAVAAAMENYRTFNNGYPTSLPSTVKPSGNDTITLSADSTTINYCVDGVSTDSPSATYYVASETKSQGALSGTCTTRPGQTLPGVPTGLATTTVNSTSIVLTWTAGSGGAASSYTVQCASDLAFIENMGASSSVSTTGTVSGLAVSSTHYCRVKATNGAGDTAWSSTITVTTGASQPPSSFARSNYNDITITFTWTAYVDALGYNVQCATNAGFTTGVTSNSTTNTTYTVTGLVANGTYYCHANSISPSSVSAWTATIITTTTATFGTIAAATALTEVSPGPVSGNFSWTGITCSLGSPQYRLTWVSPQTTSTAWSSATTATAQTYPQQTTNTWRVDSKCTYSGLDSTITASSNKIFTSTGTADPTGAFGTVGWDGRWQFNVNSSTYTCVSPAVMQYQLVATLIDATSGTWTYGWGTATSMSVNNANQGAHLTTYIQGRCLLNSISSNVLATSQRTDNASIDAPGSVPGWCAGSCGSPRGDRWSAVSCPNGTTGSYWSYLVGDYSNVVWGAYEATGFFGYDRGYYNTGNTMLNDYLMARCVSSYSASAYGPQSYARY